MLPQELQLRISTNQENVERIRTTLNSEVAIEVKSFEEHLAQDETSELSELEIVSVVSAKDLQSLRSLRHNLESLDGVVSTRIIPLHGSFGTALKYFSFVAGIMFLAFLAILGLQLFNYLMRDILFWRSPLFEILSHIESGLVLLGLISGLLFFISAKMQKGLYETLNASKKITGKKT